MPQIRDFVRTRALLISTASQLFASRGYDRSSVENIIKQAGVSKGAFYHHFSAKEEILDAVTAFMVADALHEIQAAVADRAVGAIVRLNQFLNASKAWRVAHSGLLKEVLVILHRDENASMLRKIENGSVSLLAPLLGEIIQQGIDEGVFDPPNPQETARLILQLSQAMQRSQVRTLLQSEVPGETLTLMQQRADLFIEMLERMLGAPKGSVQRLRFLETLQSLGLDRTGTGSTAKAGAE